MGVNQHSRMGGKSCPQCLRWKIADVKGIPVTRHAEVRLWIIFESAKKAPAKKINVDAPESIPWPTHEQRAQHGGEDKTDHPGNDEMAQRDFLPAFAGCSTPFSGGHEGFHGFDAGAGVHGLLVAGTIIGGNPSSWQHFSN